MLDTQYLHQRPIHIIEQEVQEISQEAQEAHLYLTHETPST